jgi:S-adenosylmethionine:tRNA ribosyltransferase-isomerase
LALGHGNFEAHAPLPGRTAAPCPAFTLADFDFDLPPELIAQHPAAERSASRLLDGTGPMPVDRVSPTCPGCCAGDLLVFNDTRVIKARLFGEKPTGGAVELLVERVLPGQRGAGPHARQQEAPPGHARCALPDGLRRRGAGPLAGPTAALFHLRFPADPYALLERTAMCRCRPTSPMPTRRRRARYQTVFAASPAPWPRPRRAALRRAAAGRAGGPRRAARGR